MAKRRQPSVPRTPEPRKEMFPEPTDEQLAADRRREQENYPSNNFALSSAVLVVLVALIVVLYVTGVIKP